jgi:hypothetical protein
MGSDGPSPNRILRIGLGFQAAQVLLAAVRLGVFDVLAAGPADADSLMQATGLHPRSAADFLDTLVALRFLGRDASGRYSNSPDSAEFLQSGQPRYLGPILHMMHRTEYQLWDSLVDALRDGRPRSAGGSRADVYGEMYREPAQVREFATAMSALTVTSAPQLAAAFPWEKCATFADLGCAEGHLPVQLALAHDHLTGVGFDLPAMRPVFERYVAGNGLAGRLTFQGGDFFADPLPAADVHIFAHVLHNWDLHGKRVLLMKSYDALPRGGAVIVLEAFIDDERRTNVSALLMSLHMLLQTDGGMDSTAGDCAGWLTVAGFRDVRSVPLSPPESILVGRK